MPVEFNEFDIEGPVLFVPNRHRDKRGVFAETFRYDDFCEVVGDTICAGKPFDQRSDQHIRGLHFQTCPYARATDPRDTR
ncbi:dTDP-4-dehydrorhamnose 3,5-epimerase family protein [Thalassospira tepidiphila]|uniref:dTDP-4-dehydrorhamnose 3,5-epimerase family protein n=1 Tax=Thalassospira tepidiphila TaxID=393657 RepID=UPI003AA8EABF